MTLSLSCPVCDRPGADADKCPHCQADLSALVALRGLPEAPEPAATESNRLGQGVSRKQGYAVPVGTGLLGLVLGLAVMGISRPHAPPQERVAVSPALEATPTPPPVAVTEPEARDQRFRYFVKRGDSLWRIARVLYGDAAVWPRLRLANPGIGERTRLRVGEVLVVPNLEELPVDEFRKSL